MTHEAVTSAVRIPVIGIVGGIGSGKTALANALSEHFRCARLDADAAGHRALNRQDVQSSLRTTFGNQIFDENGQIVRSELAKLVFGQEEKHKTAKKQLEKIVHPHIHQEIVEQLEQHRSNLDCEIILLDAALLLEAGWSNNCNAIVFVDVPVETRRERVASRGWTAAEHAQREASQMSLEEKQKRADLIVENSLDLKTAATTVANWIRQHFQLIQHNSHSKATHTPKPVKIR